uniref:hypothetical protein n=1 Tax=Escherichia coli TaxID=562 RepID=UPI001952B74F
GLRGLPGADKGDILLAVIRPQRRRIGPGLAAVHLDPRRNPRNGWALLGLAQALKARGKDASTAEKDFAAAWARADVKLSAPAF